jgi:uncharacterized protein DUF1329
MKLRRTMTVAALAALFATQTWGAASPEEARQLGTTLTAVGAEKAGNKEGTIPEYTGGIAAPAGFEPGSGMRPDPFADEKPRLVISEQNVSKYEDNLTEGTKELLKRFPTMRLDVYPTHRTVALPQRILDNTSKNATAATTNEDGSALENALPGYPFPIPKTGAEALWNHLLRYNGLGYDGPRYENWSVDAAGVPTLVGAADAYWAWPIYDPQKTGFLNNNDPYWLNKLLFVEPARRNGEAMLIVNSVNPHTEPRKAWQYMVGQRRVKRLPALAPDSPSLLNGAINNFDWKLVGKKEMYVPYSSYRLTYHKDAADITTPHHLNPDFVRWELHRVWVVEGTLKPGKMHIYKKRVFFLDEDSWAALASDQYDMKGQLYRSSFAFQSYSYDVQAPFNDTWAVYDFRTGVYNVTGLLGPHNGLKYMTEMNEIAFAPEVMAGEGLR